MRRALPRRLTSAILLCVGVSAPAGAGAIPEALLILEVTPPGSPGRYPEAAPPRFVLFDKGRFFVGGSSQLAQGQLDSREWKEMRKRLDRVRKARSSSATLSFGPDPTRYRLVLRYKADLEIAASGDPASSRDPVASLIADLASFDHPSLRFFAPEAYLLAAREGSLAGGCRAWRFPVTPAEASSSLRSIPASAASGWPTGADAASVCAGDKRYIVTLRPLLPGERP